MLLDRSFLVVIWCKTLEINFYWCLHNLLPHIGNRLVFVPQQLRY
jgi:hypothetical protein